MATLPASAWDKKKAGVLLQRAGFGGTPQEVETLAAMQPWQAVDSLLGSPNLAQADPPPSILKPSLNDKFRTVRNRLRQINTPDAEKKRQEILRALRVEQEKRLTDLRGWWLQRMADPAMAAREKMILFLHGHFATREEKVMRVIASSVAAFVAVASAQAGLVNPLIPAWAGSANTQSAQWESFTQASGGPNLPDSAGSSPFSLFNFAPGAFVTGSGNLYSINTALSIMIMGGTAGNAATPTQVVMNVSTAGSLLNSAGARLWLFDNLERASLGVIGDRGGFTYYLEQLAYASFPWVALAPLALSNIVRNTSPRVKFLLITTLLILGFFTLLETKFHHYVFPILPTFSILIALYITTRTPGRSPLFWVSLALFLLVMRDLLVTPSTLANLFVYKYDRPYPTAEDGVHATLGLAIIFVPALLTVAYAIFCRKSLILISTLSIFIYATWLSHCHFRELSPHWSQRHLIETYFNTRAPGEPLFAFNLNWRGENFYTRNQVIPVIWDDSDARIRAYVDAPGRAFILTERTTLPDLEAALSEDARSRIRLIDETSQKYGIYLVDD
jgi:hypothetical protein